MNSKNKSRLDQLLVERGLFTTRSQAAAAILAGRVLVAGQPVTKAGAPMTSEAELSLTEVPEYVSRGGLKLERAFQAFPLDVAGRVVLDGGASTGGFTDCLLKHGAARVIAVDVGYGQLDWRLRQDERVAVLERVNIRHLEPATLPATPSLATLDLSFISLKKVLPAVINCLGPDYEIVALIKPQFEAGRGQVGKGGVVRHAQVHRQVLNSLWSYAESLGCQVCGLVDSGLPGPKGNIEYLLYLIAADPAAPGDLDRAAEVDRLVGELEDKITG